MLESGLCRMACCHQGDSKRAEARGPPWPSPEGAQAGRRGLGRVAHHPCPCPHSQPVSKAVSDSHRAGQREEEGTGICTDGKVSPEQGVGTDRLVPASPDTLTPPREAPGLFPAL